MPWNTWVLAVTISAGFVANSMSEGGRQISRCKVDDKGMNAPHYNVGVTYETPSKEDGPLMSVVQISIDPKNLNRDDLVRLGLKLKKDFCKEERLFAVLYADSAYIDHIYVSNDLLFHKAEESKRGYYYVDRQTGEEYITYSTVPNYRKNPEKRVRIELGLPSMPKNAYTKNAVRGLA